MAPLLHTPRQLAARLKSAPELTAIFVATWCPFSTKYLSKAITTDDTIHIDISDMEDPAWDTHKIVVVPTAVRYQNGKEIARAAANAITGLSPEKVSGLARR